MVDFNWADWLIIVVVTISCVFGVKRGLIKEALSIVNLVVAIAVSLSFGDYVSVLLIDLVPSTPLRHAVSFGLLFLGTMMLGVAVNRLVSTVVKVAGLSVLDRALGLAFGLARGVAVVFAVILITPDVIAIEQSPWWSESLIIPNLMVYEDIARLSGTEAKILLIAVLKEM